LRSLDRPHADAIEAVAVAPSGPVLASRQQPRRPIRLGNSHQQSDPPHAVGMLRCA
jgi:hypothetical protein